jgi:tRNA pseudouridine55 synthase
LIERDEGSPPQSGQLPPVPDGLLVVDKPLQWSSMTVVRKLRQAVRRGLDPRADELVDGRPKKKRKVKVGHAGTLDPLATGIVVCCVGKATKLVSQLMGLTKVYEAQVDLSAFTVGDDREGERREVDVAKPPEEATVRAVLDGFVGEIQQVPPAHSALWVNGQRAYKLARAGEDVQLEPRTVRIDAIELLSYAWPMVRIRVTTGKGVYIRALARDLGKALGTGGHLAALRRTAVGRFDLSMAVQPERLAGAVVQQDLIPIDR